MLKPRLSVTVVKTNAWQEVITVIKLDTIDNYYNLLSMLDTNHGCTQGY